MERILYEKPFTEQNTPDWQCPTCEKGLLRIKKGTFFYKELFESKKAHADSPNEWEPDWNTYTYSCLLQCSNDKCKEIVSNIGRGYVTQYQDDEEFELTDYFEPKFFYPHLKIIKIPKKTPKIVTDALNTSFELFFCNPSAASNHVRTALELLLIEQKMKHFVIPKKYDIAQIIEKTIKELNGTIYTINLNILMNAYDIMEYLLAEIYEDKYIKELIRIEEKFNSKDEIDNLIAEGEGNYLEFKSSLRWDIKENHLNKELEQVVLKSIAAFSNSEGGTLIIGVSNAGEVLGLENDYNSLIRDDKPIITKDEFELHLRNLINKTFGVSFASMHIDINFKITNDKEICIFNTKRGDEPLFLNVTDKNGQKQEKFYVRNGNRSDEIIGLNNITSYIRKRFDAH